MLVEFDLCAVSPGIGLCSTDLQIKCPFALCRGHKWLALTDFTHLWLVLLHSVRWFRCNQFVSWHNPWVLDG